MSISFGALFFGYFIWQLTVGLEELYSEWKADRDALRKK
jgi:hypothetical protein